MKKIYTMAALGLLSVSSFAQISSEAGNAVFLSSKPLVHATSAERMTNPDTTGLVNVDDFMPVFVGANASIYGYSGGGYIYGNNKSANLKICAQGYLNIGPIPVSVVGVLLWFAKTEHDNPAAPATSKVVIKAYNMAANRSANTNGSGAVNTTLNWPGPATVVSATANLLFSAIDTLDFTYVPFATIPTFAGDFVIACDASTLAAGDTVGLVSDAQNDAQNLDYTFHYYQGISKWIVTDQLFSDPVTGGSGGLDNNIAIFAVLNDATGVNEFYNSMKLTTYPNPSVEKVTIEYTIEKNSENVSLIVYSPTGQKLIDNKYTNQTAGTYQVELETSKLAAGTYFYKLNANGRNFTKRFVISK